MSPLLQMPSVGAATAGISRRSARPACSAARFARYQFRLAVSAPGRTRSATAASTSGWLRPRRKLAKSSADSHCSATPSNWNRSMYHDFSRCSKPASRNAAGCPTDSAARWSTRSGAEGGSAQASAAPQSCPTTWAPFDPEVVEHAEHVAGDGEQCVGLDVVRAVGLAEAAQVGRDRPEAGRGQVSTWCRHSRWESGQPCRSRTTGPLRGPRPRDRSRSPRLACDLLTVNTMRSSS